LPLTGQADFEFDRDGTVLSASAVLSAGAGHVGFPRYISQSLLVDEGEFYLTYVPETGTIAVEDSALFVAGSRATINGSLLPVRNEAGAIESLRYELLAQNVSLDSSPGAAEQLSSCAASRRSKRGASTWSIWPCVPATRRFSFAVRSWRAPRCRLCSCAAQ
jgi:hypothetical protein